MSPNSFSDKKVVRLRDTARNPIHTVVSDSHNLGVANVLEIYSPVPARSSAASAVMERQGCLATAALGAPAVRKHGGGQALRALLTEQTEGRHARLTGGEIKSLCCVAAGIIALASRPCGAHAHPLTGVRRAAHPAAPLRSSPRPHAQHVLKVPQRTLSRKRRNAAHRIDLRRFEAHSLGWLAIRMEINKRADRLRHFVVLELQVFIPSSNLAEPELTRTLKDINERAVNQINAAFYSQPGVSHGFVFDRCKSDRLHVGCATSDHILEMLVLGEGDRASVSDLIHKMPNACNCIASSLQSFFHVLVCIAVSGRFFSCAGSSRLLTGDILLPVSDRETSQYRTDGSDGLNPAADITRLHIGNEAQAKYQNSQQPDWNYYQAQHARQPVKKRPAPDSHSSSLSLPALVMESLLSFGAAVHNRFVTARMEDAA